MSAFPIPVDFYNHYVMMMTQLSTRQVPDLFGLENHRIQTEIRSIVMALENTHGKHIVMRLNSGQLIISGSFQDLQMLSNEISLEDITYFGVVCEDTIQRLRKIMYE